MKKYLLSFSVVLFLCLQSNITEAQTGGVTIGADKSPHPSAILDLQGTNKGFLPPRMSSEERNRISSPAAGLIVYDTDFKRIFYFDGVKWMSFAGNEDGQVKTSNTQVRTAGQTYDSSITGALDSNNMPPVGSVVFDSGSTKMAYFDGNVWRDGNTSCLPTLMHRISVTRPGSAASAFDTSGSLLLFNQNIARRVYDQSNADLGIAIEANDSNLIYQSEVLTDLGTYAGTAWARSNVNANAAGVLAGRPRFLLIKTDNSAGAAYIKTGLKLKTGSPYLAGILVQKASCTSVRINFRSDGAGTDGFITLDLATGTVTDGGTGASGVFSNGRAIPLKNVTGGYMLLFTFTPSTQASSNTTHSFQIIPNSTTSGDALYVSAPFIIQTANIWATYIAAGQQVNTRGQEFAKLDLGMQATGTVLVKSIQNDRTTRKSRAISWRALTGTSGLNMGGTGFTGGYAVAENGVLIDSGGEKIITSAPAGGNSYYVDPTANAGGDGSIASPFRSFSQLPLFSGNLSGAQIFIKRGTRIREQLTMANSSNFTIDAYGTGALPILDGSDTIKTPYTQEGSVWYLSNQSLGQTIFVNNARLISVKTKDQMSANVNTCWFDATNKRMYVNIGAVDPNTQLTEVTSRLYACRITSCSRFVVRNIQFQRARNSGLSIESAQQIQTSKNSVVEKCISVYNGAFDVASRLAGDGFVWYGMNSNTKSSGNVIRQCVSNYNVNCSYEFGFQDSLLIEDNYGTRNGQGIELWGFITNSTIRRNYIMNTIPVGVSWGHGNGVWFANSTIEPGITGGSTKNKIYSNVFATTWQEILDVECGSHEFSNNLFFDPIRRREDANGSFVFASRMGGADSIKLTLKNNIFYNPSYHAYRASAIFIDNTVSSAVLNYNYYYNDPAVATSTPWIYMGTSYGSSFINYKNATKQDSNSYSQVNPAFVKLASKTVTDVFQTYNTGNVKATMVMTDEANTDFHLSPSSPCRNTGDSTTDPIVAIDFAPYGTSKAVGPYSNVTGNPISFGDLWLGGLNFRGGTLLDVQGSTGSLPNTTEVIKLSLCK